LQLLTLFPCFRVDELSNPGQRISQQTVQINFIQHSLPLNNTYMVVVTVGPVLEGKKENYSVVD